MSRSTSTIRLVVCSIVLVLLSAFGMVAYAAPPTPTGFWTYPSTAHQIYVAWDEVIETTNYIIQWRVSGQATWNEISGYPYTSWQHLELNCATTYQYRVAAFSLETGQSPWTGTLSETTLNCPVSTPTNVKAEAQSASKIRISWNDVSGETGYKVEKSSNGTDWQILQTVPADVGSVFHENLSCNTKYYYRVHAFNADGPSNWVVVNATTNNCGLNTPSNLHVTDTTKSSISIAWNDVAGETGYEIEYSNNNSDWSLLHVAGANDTSYTDPALQCGTIRYYRVRAVSNDVKSGFSNVASAFTDDCTMAVELLKNGGFETDANANNLPDTWKAKGSMSADGLTAKTKFVYSGAKAMLFRGKSQPNDRLLQGVDLSNVLFEEGSKLEISARINHVRGAAVNNAIVVQLAYSDGTGEQIKLNTEPNKKAGYVYRANWTILDRTDITAIVVKIAYNKPDGKIAFDDVSLKLTRPANQLTVVPDSPESVPDAPEATNSNSQWIPLPAAPTN